MIQRRLDSGEWLRLLPRTFLTSDTQTYDDRLRAALAFAGRGALLSAGAGLDDLGLRGVERPNRILVLVPPTTRLRPTGFVLIRPTRRTPERAWRPGPARASVARCVADLAHEARFADPVTALVTAVVRRELCTVAELEAELRAGRRNGSAFLRRAVEDVALGAWSLPEGMAARLLRAGHVPAFEQNATVVLPSGRIVVVDFLWRELRAVLEIDSDAHHGMPGDARDTSDRHMALEAAGFSVVHRTPRLVAREPAIFVQGIRAWLDGLRVSRRSALPA